MLSWADRLATTLHGSLACSVHPLPLACQAVSALYLSVVDER